jgi:hypothetical protein
VFTAQPQAKGRKRTGENKKMKREIVSVAFILMLFVSMQLSSLPLVSGLPDKNLGEVEIV